MGLLDKLRYPRTNSVYLDIANTVFKARCGDKFPDDMYREHPELKVQDWKAIKDELAQLCAGPEDSEMAKRLRKRWARSIETLVMTRWYLNLPEDERQLVAQHIWNSTAQIQDDAYYFAHTYWYMLQAILEAFIINACVSEVAKDKLRALADNWIDLCKQHNEFLRRIAKARGEGRELSDSEREEGKRVVILRTATGRALSGEKVFDDGAE
jgi:hypothetical protein